MDYEFDLYIHIHGTIDAESDSDSDMIDAIFPDGYEGEILGVAGEITLLREDT